MKSFYALAPKMLFELKSISLMQFRLKNTWKKPQKKNPVQFGGESVVP